MLGHATNQQILSEMDDLVIGHEKAKKLLITLVNRSKMSHRRKFLEGEPPLEKMNLLLIGASGTGKTHLIESLQKLINFPLVKIDGSRLNPEANATYSYKDIQKAIVANAKRLVADSSQPYFSLEGTIDQTVVFIDEMDKLCISFGKTEGWNTRTQGELLTLVEDQEDFKNVSFVFAGAFTQLRQTTKSSSIGFSSTDVGDDVTKECITEKDLIKIGLTTELLGRITAINELDVMTYDTMLTILETLIIPNKLQDISHFTSNGIDMFTEAFKDKLIKDALDSGQGVRYLKRKINDMFLDLEFEYESKQLPAVITQ